LPNIKIDELFLELGFKDFRDFTRELDNLVELLDRVEDLSKEGAIEVGIDVSKIKIPQFDMSKVEELLWKVEQFLIRKDPRSYETKKLIATAATLVEDTIIPRLTEAFRHDPKVGKSMIDTLRISLTNAIARGSTALAPFIGSLERGAEKSLTFKKFGVLMTEVQRAIDTALPKGIEDMITKIARGGNLQDFLTGLASKREYIPLTRTKEGLSIFREKYEEEGVERRFGIDLAYMLKESGVDKIVLREMPSGIHDILAEMRKFTTEVASFEKGTISKKAFDRTFSKLLENIEKQKVDLTPEQSDRLNTIIKSATKELEETGSLRWQRYFKLEILNFWEGAGAKAINREIRDSGLQGKLETIHGNLNELVLNTKIWSGKDIRDSINHIETLLETTKLKKWEMKGYTALLNSIKDLQKSLGENVESSPNNTEER
jgi:hypothetical protein